MLKEGFQRLEATTKFTMRLLAFKGEPVVAIYSSIKRMTDVIPEEYYRETGYIQLNCKMLLQTVVSWERNTKLALNPGHTLVKTFSPEEVKALLDGSIFKQIEEDWIAASPTNIPLPKEMWNKHGLDRFSSSRRDSLVICLKLSKNSRRTFQQVLFNLGPTIHSVLGEKELLDILDATGKAEAWINRLIPFFPR